jgi:hypothetical protein
MPIYTTSYSMFRRFLRFAKLILGLVLLVLEVIRRISEL